VKKFNWLNLSEAEFMELADLEGLYPIAAGRPVAKLQQETPVLIADAVIHQAKGTSRKRTRTGTGYVRRNSSSVGTTEGVAALTEPGF